MEQRVSIITLGVADLERARAFYDALGWGAVNAGTPEAESIAAYNLPGVALCLYPLEKLAEDAGVPAGRPSGAVALAHNVRSPEEVDATLREAARAGGRVVRPAARAFWGGYSGYFADPDGHLWEVAHNPFSPLDPGGAFRWGGA